MKLKYFLVAFSLMNLSGCNTTNNTGVPINSSINKEVIFTTKFPEILPAETKITEQVSRIPSSEHQKIIDTFLLKSDNSTLILQEANDNLGGLKPSYEIAYNENYCEFEQSKSLISYSRSLFDGPICRTYIIKKDDRVELIKTPEEFKKTFAPIESKQEALSYILALQPILYPVYNFPLDKANTYNVDKINKTNVIETEKGYQVNLYSDSCYFGVTEITQTVKKDGTIENVGSKNIYYDTFQDKGVKDGSIICD